MGKQLLATKQKSHSELTVDDRAVIGPNNKKQSADTCVPSHPMTNKYTTHAWFTRVETEGDELEDYRRW